MSPMFRTFLSRLTTPVLCALALAAPLAAWLAMELKLPGTAHAFFSICVFDVLVWPALLLALLLRLLEEGLRGVLRALLRVPAAAWFLLALAVWTGLAWPLLGGPGGRGAGAALRGILQLAEYAVAGYLAVAELGRGERARRWAALALQAGFALVIAVGLVQYFGPRPDFEVGSLLRNRNSLGAFLAAAVPFCLLMALGRSGCCCGWRPLWAVLAAGGALLALTAGAILGILCGAIAGAALLGRLRLAVAVAGLALLFAAGQALPRHNLGAAAESVRVERTDPHDPEGKRKLLAMRYLRAGYEVNVVRAGLGPERGQLFFGLRPGGYGLEKNRFPFEKPQGEVKPGNYDVLCDEPGTFNLYGQAAVEMGVLGLLGFLWLFASWSGTAFAAWRKRGQELPEPFAAAILAAVVGAAVASVFGSAWIRGAGEVLAVLAALAAAELRDESSSPASPAGGGRVVEPSVRVLPPEGRP